MVTKKGTPVKKTKDVKIAANVMADSIKTEEKVDIREKLFYKMADNKMPILKMHSTRISLEDVFLELTENEKEDKKEQFQEIPETIEDSQEEEENDSDL